MTVAIFPAMRIVLISALSLAAAVQVVRSAIATRFVGDQPARAATFWPRHPRVQLALAMAQIGQAAATGAAPDPTTIDLGMNAARGAPLAIEPFLIRGAIAQSEQRPNQAERLFVEAVRRDPRSSAARYFLAQRYLTSGRPLDGLRQASALVRLVSGGSGALVPAMAQYATIPGAVPTLLAMFATDPELRDMVLATLARDAGNTRLILKLAADEIGKSDPSVAPNWQAILLTSLVERGDYPTARALWLRISGLQVTPAGLFNPQFASLPAPAPFNWTFGSGDFGVAEPASGGLQLLYYGRVNALFATQTLLLAPGGYELRMKVVRDGGGEGNSGLAWTINCLPAGKAVLALPLGGAGAGQAITGRLTIPAGCAAQQIKLSGTARDLAKSEQVTLSKLELVRVTP